MIVAVVYDKCPNTHIGQMGGELRVVGHHYPLPGINADKLGRHPKLEVIMEDARRDHKVIVLIYSDGSQQVIPDRGVEKILKFE
jgi:hypothetical protein